MRKVLISLSLLCAALLSSASGWASPPDGGGPLGVGFVLGAPTAFTVKYWTYRDTAIDGGIGVRSGDLELYGDYLWHVEQIRLDYGTMPFYLGLGGRVHFKNDKDEDTVLGVRFVTGLAYHLPDYPFEFFGEIVPSLRLTPSVGGDVDVGVGVRYYFRAYHPRHAR